jgi:hypothetical protein
MGRGSVVAHLIFGFKLFQRTDRLAGVQGMSVVAVSGHVGGLGNGLDGHSGRSELEANKLKKQMHDARLTHSRWSNGSRKLIVRNGTDWMDPESAQVTQ